MAVGPQKVLNTIRQWPWTLWAALASILLGVVLLLLSDRPREPAANAAYGALGASVAFLATGLTERRQAQARERQALDETRRVLLMARALLALQQRGSPEIAATVVNAVYYQHHLLKGPNEPEAFLAALLGSHPPYPPLGKIDELIGEVNRRLEGR